MLNQQRHTSSNLKSPNNQSLGFTIVELLIVVVVIAILAAITTVSYNGIVNQTKKATIEGSLVAVNKKVQLYAVENSDTYPVSLTQVGIQGSDKDSSTTWRYWVDNTDSSRTYCITGINGQNRSYINQSRNTPTQGVCPGHEDSNYMTNYAYNPSFEERIVIGEGDGEWGVYDGVTIERVKSRHLSGSYSMKVTSPSTAPSRSSSAAVCFESIKPSTHYAARVAISAETKVTGVTISMNVGSSSRYTTLTANTGWRYANSNSMGESSSTNACLSVRFSENTPPYSSIYIDNVFIAETPLDSFIPESTPYSDGSSPGWIWNGNSGNSTSTGPK